VRSSLVIESRLSHLEIPMRYRFPWPRKVRVSSAEFFRRRPRARMCLERLEGRSLMSTGFVQTNLVSDVPGAAQTTDSNLVNPWGISLAPGQPFWIADNGTGKSTLYDGAGATQPLVVTIPAPTAGATSAPTGTVFNPGNTFAVSAGGMTGASAFLFATEDGTIAGWSPAVNQTQAVIAVNRSAAGAVYKGLAIGTNAGGTFLYAADFHNGAIDVFNTNFTKVSLAGNFTDASIPAGFAPFNVQNIGGSLFVTYAKQNDAKHDDVAGAGNGFVDAFDTSGNLLRRFASQGTLNSPWGLAQAPASFGTLGGDILVGNFGDGTINAFDPNSGALAGQLQGTSGQTLAISGLWGLTFGTGGSGGSTGTLYFTAGTEHEQHGLFGSLAPAATPSPSPTPTPTPTPTPSPSPDPAPTLLNEQRIFAGKGRAHRLVGFQLNFSTALNPSTAQSAGNYQVIQPARSKHAHAKAVALKAATYNPANNSVTLMLGKFNTALPLQLAATGLTSAAGTAAGTITSKL
jgi:uncharacterized protein (TIGR03118 family)